MMCPKCEQDDGEKRGAEKLLGRTEKNAPIRCHTFGCGHRWHLPLSVECDCPDYKSPSN